MIMPKPKSGNAKPVRSYRISEDTHEILGELAGIYKKSRAFIIDNIVRDYGLKMIKKHQKIRDNMES